jgi:pimeloyl-ACP methyl ester carboxylesterase
MEDGLWRLPPRQPREEIERRQRRHRRLRLAALGAVVLALAGGIAAAVVRHDGGRRAETLAGFRRCLLADGVTGLCGRVAVPVDPNRPDGRRLRLRVAVLLATGSPRDGALFYLEGGPGGAATQSAGTASVLLGRVQRRRDVVLVDQRGTGGSGALSCPPPRSGAPLAPWLRGCLAGHDEARFLTSAAAAADLEAVRRALGYGRIDLFGASYGATLAQVYLRRYPHSVRSLVLDAATPLGAPVYALEPATAERSLAAVLRACTAEARCRRAHPGLARDLRTVLRGAGRLDAAQVASTLEALTRTLDGQAVIPFDLDQAARGDPKPLEQDFATYVGLGVDPRLRLAMAWEIQCSEPWARLGPPGDGYFAAAARARNALLRSGCAAVSPGWVPAGSEVAAPARVPALVLAGTTDPQSAPDRAAWSRLFPSGREVVVPGGAHGVAATGCVPGLIAAFVERGDGRGLATACARRPVAPRFELG